MRSITVIKKQNRCPHRVHIGRAGSPWVVSAKVSGNQQRTVRPERAAITTESWSRYPPTGARPRSDFAFRCHGLLFSQRKPCFFPLFFFPRCLSELKAPGSSDLKLQCLPPTGVEGNCLFRVATKGMGSGIAIYFVTMTTDVVLILRQARQTAGAGWGTDASLVIQPPLEQGFLGVFKPPSLPGDWWNVNPLNQLCRRQQQKGSWKTVYRWTLSMHSNLSL